MKPEEVTILLELKEEVTEIKVDLKEHMRRTNILEKQAQGNFERIMALEEPKKLRERLKEILIDSGKIAGAVLTVFALLAMLKEHI